MAAVSEYESLLRRLHALDRSGKNESDEADLLREQMEAPWVRMTPAERQMMNALSADLAVDRFYLPFDDSRRPDGVE